MAEDPIPQHERSRGPFEPLVSSRARPGAAASAARQAHHDGTQAHERARTLDQLKDLYRAAEAIGEQNVDRHFNELLAQQRQLISEYFGQDRAAADGQAEPQQAVPPAPAPPSADDVTPPEGLAVRAVPPRTW